MPPTCRLRSIAGGTRDGFAGQFTQNSNAVREAGCEVETLILQGYPHGYGAAGSSDVWGKAFDAFLTPIMSRNTTAVENTTDDTAWEPTRIYNQQGQSVSADDMRSGIYILSDGTRTRKIAVGNL